MKLLAYLLCLATGHNPKWSHTEQKGREVIMHYRCKACGHRSVKCYGMEHANGGK